MSTPLIRQSIYIVLVNEDHFVAVGLVLSKIGDRDLVSKPDRHGNRQIRALFPQCHDNRDFPDARGRLNTALAMDGRVRVTRG